MVNKNKWIQNYNNLIPDSQLEVAEAILKELNDNEMALSESEYDQKKSKIVRKLLIAIMHNTKQADEYKKFASVLEKFESLSPTNKRKVINAIYKNITKYLGIQEKEKTEKICKYEGHIFDEWIHKKWTTYEDTIIDHQFVEKLPINHNKWERSCPRCGYKEVIYNEPQELIDARKENDKKMQIKKLELELKKLKSE